MGRHKNIIRNQTFIQIALLARNTPFIIFFIKILYLKNYKRYFNNTWLII